MRKTLAQVWTHLKTVGYTVWHVPAVQSIAATLIVRTLTMIGVPALFASAGYEALKAVIG